MIGPLCWYWIGPGHWAALDPSGALWVAFLV